MKTRLLYCKHCLTPYAMSGDVSNDKTPCCNAIYIEDYDTEFIRLAEQENLVTKEVNDGNTS